MSSVIVETLTGKIAEPATGRFAPRWQDQPRPESVMADICERMNRDAKALGIKTRYQLAKGCDYCDGTGRQQGDHWYECGFCKNGVVR